MSHTGPLLTSVAPPVIVTLFVPDLQDSPD
jgi:hypothetical protein